MLKQAAIMPRKAISHAVKSGAEVALERSKEILRSNSDNYTMKFKDGNKWSKQDIIDNLTVKLEKGKRKQKRVAQVNFKDYRVGLYANFPEYGYTNPITGQEHEALHFIRDGLSQAKRQVENAMLDDIAKSLDKIKSK